MPKKVLIIAYYWPPAGGPGVQRWLKFVKYLQEFGIESKNLLLYRVLDGDKSDNIPGVYGCGIKTLVKRFPEITEYYTNAL